jgi:phage N-6-adenine-methyltransferase
MEALSLIQSTTGAITSLQDAKAIASQVKGAHEMKRVAATLGKSIPEINDFARRTIELKQQLGSWYESLPDGKTGPKTIRPERSGETLNKAKAQEETGISNDSFNKFVNMSKCPEEVLDKYHDKANAEGSILKEDVIERAGKVVRNGGKPEECDSYDGNRWYTPKEVIDAAKAVLGTIDLDPASDEAANEHVGAAEIFTEEDNGLEQDWHGNVWLNPPYSYPLVEQFCDKALAEFQAGNIDQCIVLVNNCTDAKWFMRLAENCPMMFSQGRFKFWNPGHACQTRQGQALFYMGNDKKQFFKSFEGLAYAPNVGGCN